ncbi:permease [Pseudolysinimonas yzui]|uniref:permease n=1 Tax=Pseudolysinimonas yzui TaxID=2708254 RepID=UPI001749FBD0|nr:permease [Pseudolysinimonas yzui]
MSTTHPTTLPTRRGASPARYVIAGVVLVAGMALLRVFAPGDVELGDIAQDFVTLSLAVIIESIPFVFLGIGLAVVVQVWVPERVILRVLPRNPILRRMVLSLLGVLLPVCECGNVPLSRGLVMRGLTVPEAMTFLVAAPIVNPVTIITTYQAFGFDDGILIARVVGGFAIANLVGWLFSKSPDPDALLTRSFSATCKRAQDHAHDGHSGRWRRSVENFSAETTAMMPALLVGSAVAGLIQVAISRDVLVTLGSNPVISVFVLMLLAFVISVCSNVDAFFVLALGSTFLPGAIVAFLLFGPVIDIKMLALMRTTYSARTLALLNLVVGLGAATIGLAINLA